MYATSMGHRLSQSSRALVVKAREAGENRAYSLYMLTRLRLDAPLALPTLASLVVEQLTGLPALGVTAIPKDKIPANWAVADGNFRIRY